MPVTLLVNPAAGGGDATGRLTRVAELLAPLGPVTLIVAPTLPELMAAARAAASAGHTIIVAGGDGTVHHVVNAVFPVPATIGVLPAGRGNDLARALGLPLEIETAARRLARGRTRTMDVADVNGHAFCTVGGTGLIADSTADVSRWTSPESSFRVPARWLRGNAYLVSAATRILWANSLEVVRVTGQGPAGGWSWQGSAHTIVVANQRQMGEGLILPIPSADDDGILDVCIVPRRPRLSLVSKLAALKTGRSLGPDVLHIERATTVRIELEKERPFAADGEVLFEANVFVVVVRPSALHVLV